MSNTKQSGFRSPVGALHARRRFAAITGSKFCIKSYPLLASSQHVGATAAVTILFIMLFLTKDNSRPAGLFKQLLSGTVFRTVLYWTVFSFIFILFRTVFYWTFCMGLVCTDTVILKCF